MENTRLFSVNAFAQMAQITLVMLRHYDKLGLLNPVTRGENNYRYYSISQLSQVNLIRTMQKLGMSLREIKKLKDMRTPAKTASILKNQLVKIDEKIDEWNDARTLISALLDPITSVHDIDETAFSIQNLPPRLMILGDKYEYREGENGYDSLVAFYNATRERYPRMSLHYPVWGVFDNDSLLRKMDGERNMPDRYYFYTDEGTATRPEGLYAIGYSRGNYGDCDDLYLRLKGYIRSMGFYAHADAYEEYPLNEICISNTSNYLTRVMIAVKKRDV